MARWFNTNRAKTVLGILVLGAIYLAYQYSGDSTLAGPRRPQGPVGFGWGAAPYWGGSSRGNPTKLREIPSGGGGSCSCNH